jgi:hypothetical protein
VVGQVPEAEAEPGSGLIPNGAHTVPVFNWGSVARELLRATQGPSCPGLELE